MDKETFSEKHEQLSSSIRALERELRGMEKEYIATQRKFEDGDPVWYRGDAGFIQRVERVTGGGDIIYSAKRMKKDGTMSSWELTYSASEWMFEPR